MLNAHLCVCRHAQCLQMYSVSAPFELLLDFPQTFSKLRPAYDRTPPLIWDNIGKAQGGTTTLHKTY